MRFVCDAPKRRIWFAIETQAEADAESALMTHAVARFFAQAHEIATRSYRPADPHGIERDIGLKAHIRRTMPLFLTLRDDAGAGLATAMLAPEGDPPESVRRIIVGPDNADPYPNHADAIEALSRHLGYPLERADCYPYGR